MTLTVISRIIDEIIDPDFYVSNLPESEWNVEMRAVGGDYRLSEVPEDLLSVVEELSKDKPTMNPYEQLGVKIGWVEKSRLDEIKEKRLKFMSATKKDREFMYVYDSEQGVYNSDEVLAGQSTIFMRKNIKMERLVYCKNGDETFTPSEEYKLVFWNFVEKLNKLEGKGRKELISKEGNSYKHNCVRASCDICKSIWDTEIGSDFLCPKCTKSWQRKFAQFEGVQDVVNWSMRALMEHLGIQHLQVPRYSRGMSIRDKMPDVVNTSQLMYQLVTDHDRNWNRDGTYSWERCLRCLTVINEYLKLGRVVAERYIKDYKITKATKRKYNVKNFDLIPVDINKQKNVKRNELIKKCSIIDGEIKVGV